MTTEERAAVQAALRSKQAFTLRRAQILLASSDGQDVSIIAENLNCATQTVRNALHAFNTHGLNSLQPQSNRPKRISSSFDQTALERLQELLKHNPRTYGQHNSLWTLQALAEVSYAQGLTEQQVSYETIRRAFKQLGVNWKRAKHWITSPDEQYDVKKTGGTG